MKLLPVWFCLLTMLAACASPQPASAISSPTLVRQAPPSPTTTAANPAAVEIEESPQACLAAGGEVHEFRLDSELLSDPMPVRVYTPPCYYEQIERSYPVLYLIHGQNYAADQWDRLGADEAADALIAAGATSPFLIVMPEDSNHYLRPSRNPFGEAFVDELIPWVEASYRVNPQREQRAVGGLSRGASWAIHLTFSHPKLFGALGAHSPPVFREDRGQLPDRLDALAIAERPRIWLDIGERDSRNIIDLATWFTRLLDERGIPYQWSLFTGDHSEEYWSRHLELYLRWYAAEW